MKRFFVLSWVVVLAIAGVSFAGDKHDSGDVAFTDGAAQTMHYGAAVQTGKAKADTVVIFGGAGTLEGKFEDAMGVPTLAGWETIDMTQKDSSFWHIDTYHAQMIGGMGPGNHAWWCGDVFDSCGAGDDAEGYGDSWHERLDWTGTVADNSVDTDVTIEFDMAYESEPGFDGTTLMYRSEFGMVDLAYWDGADTVLADVYNFTLGPADYAGTTGDEVLIRFEFISDGGWSDEDCAYPTDGAIQLDDIAVYFDQGSGNVLQGVVEDCEGKAPAQWYTSLPPGVGDYSKVWTALDDFDPCRSNATSVVAFIDDGVVVPGTGGTTCITWCYGPGGYTVNPEGGLAGPDAHLQNFVHSPLIEWPTGGDYDGATLRYDVYIHADLSYAGFEGTFYDWSIRSTVDPAGVDGWSDWQDENFVYYGAGFWIRERFDVSGMLIAGRRWVQFRLGANELGYLWGFTGIDASPAPYFDNPRLVAYEYGGPAIASREIDMLQDNFPEIGDIDYEDLGRNSIRIDMARNISAAAHLRNDPGDSMVIDVTPVRTGAVLNGAPRMYYKFQTNPVFDAVRDGAFTAMGYVEGDSSKTATGTWVEDRWAFELPDEGWLFPGDVFHWYISAQDNVSGDIGTSLLPADTTGFSDFVNPMSYHTSFVVRGLPTIFDDAGSLVTPSTLFWNDFGNRGAEREWYTALDNLGYVLGHDYDIFYTNGPSSGIGNGLGGRASSSQISGYDNMLYSAGSSATITISNLDYELDPGDDVGLVDEWLRLGNKDMAIFGDDVVFDMDTTPQGLSFISDWMGVSLTDRDLNPLIGNQSTPTIVTDDGNSVFSATTEWVAYGGCLGFNTFDAVEVTIGERLAHFLDPSGENSYDYSAATLNYVADYNSSVMSFPYGFLFVYNPAKAPLPSSARTQLLEEVMIHFDALPETPVETATAPRPFMSVAAYPNPFNPQTTVSWSLGEAARKMTVEVFNLRGHLVKTLVNDSMMPGEGHVVWSGDDNMGAKVASGVYFARVRAPEFTKTVKIALVK